MRGPQGPVPTNPLTAEGRWGLAAKSIEGMQRAAQRGTPSVGNMIGGTAWDLAKGLGTDAMLGTPGVATGTLIGRRLVKGLGRQAARAVGDPAMEAAKNFALGKAGVRPTIPGFAQAADDVVNVEARVIRPEAPKVYNTKPQRPKAPPKPAAPQPGAQAPATPPQPPAPPSVGPPGEQLGIPGADVPGVSRAQFMEMLTKRAPLPDKAAVRASVKEKAKALAEAAAKEQEAVRGWAGKTPKARADDRKAWVNRRTRDFIAQLMEESGLSEIKVGRRSKAPPPEQLSFPWLQAVSRPPS